MEVNLEDIEVMYVLSKGGVSGAKEAFDKLESKLPSLRKRKFYGVLKGGPQEGEFRACVAIMEGDNPSFWGLDTWTIPGGKYARRKIKDWERNLELVGPTFESMAEEYEHDSTRPKIEFYRSQRDLILFLPIK